MLVDVVEGWMTLQAWGDEGHWFSLLFVVYFGVLFHDLLFYFIICVNTLKKYISLLNHSVCSE